MAMAIGGLAAALDAKVIWEEEEEREGEREEEKDVQSMQLVQLMMLVMHLMLVMHQHLMPVPVYPSLVKVEAAMGWKA